MKRTAKRARSQIQQRGQFMTPPLLAQLLVTDLELTAQNTVLEPSFGDGSFLVPLIEQLMALRSGPSRERFCAVMRENLYGVELDAELYWQALDRIRCTYGPLPPDHNLRLADYFRADLPVPEGFDLVIGNPPFGGTFDASIEDWLDKRYGSYGGHKLKKETYSFFVAKSIEELAPGGKLRFICSDTFLTIKTMRGLRELLLDSGEIAVEDMPGAFEGTTQPMVVLNLNAGPEGQAASIRGSRLSRDAMAMTPNFSWGVSPELAPLFDGPLLGDFIVATGGMTIGRNELFVREIQPDGSILESYDFEFFERPITVSGELERARLNRLSKQQLDRVKRAEEEGATRRAVRSVPLETPRCVPLPHADYAPYNRASSQRIYSDPTHMVYWREEGDAVLTFKRDGPWYLHGVGGKPFFKREGITWQLVAPRINARYLPAGYILDSGAPCAFLREEVDAHELFVILAWLQTPLATTLLKQVINHTRNIQGKDVERLPYPFWTPPDIRRKAASLVERTITALRSGHAIEASLGTQLDAMFQPPSTLEVAA
jgi:hypothetical protein